MILTNSSSPAPRPSAVLRPLIHANTHLLGNTGKRVPERNLEDRSRESLPTPRPRRKRNEWWDDARSTSGEAAIEPGEHSAQVIWSAFYEALDLSNY